MFTVRVPATSANMGPAFDTAGIALSLYNTLEVRTPDDCDFEGNFKIEIQSRIDGRIGAGQQIPTDESNLIYSTMLEFAKETGTKLPPVYLKQTDEIPLARGLGSSAACIVAGLSAANKLTGGKVSDKELLYMAVKTEGHPDNAAPAFLGNMVVGVLENGGFEYVKIDVDAELEFTALIPDFPLSTSKARKVLPENYTKAQAVFNCSHAALLTAAMMSKNTDALSFALKDAIHQPYRQTLIPGMETILSKLGQAGCIGGYLSGAGPTLMAVGKKSDGVIKELERITAELDNFWLVKPLEVDRNGVLITESV